MSERSLLLLGNNVITIPVIKCGAQVAASIWCVHTDLQSWMCSLGCLLGMMLYIVSRVQCWMSVGQDCNAVSCLQDMDEKLAEITLLLMQHEQAYDLAEAWAVKIAGEVDAHKQAIQQVEDAKLRLSAQPTSNSAAASF